MARDRKARKGYSFEELAPEVQQKVLERLRENAFDPDSLSEQFESILSERGLSDPKTGWSLGYCQGDGVAFWGYLDLEAFFKWIFSGDTHATPFIKDAKRFRFMEDVVSVNISHKSIYYHSNSMTVEVELTGSAVDLVSKEHRNEVRKYFRDLDDQREQWHEAVAGAKWASQAPIRDWEDQMRSRVKLPRKGPKEWRPQRDIPKPEPLPIEVIPEPAIEAPPNLERMMDVADKKFKEIDAEGGLFEFHKFIKSWTEITSTELETMGYAEIEYQQSEESIKEMVEVNDYRFDEDGDRLRE